jgi:hypothetical protein
MNTNETFFAILAETGRVLRSAKLEAVHRRIAGRAHKAYATNGDLAVRIKILKLEGLRGVFAPLWPNAKAMPLEEVLAAAAGKS